jgi:DNA primase
MILVEGNMDVISLHQAGFKNVVAPLGTALTEEQIKLLAKLTKEIVLLFDADVAGQKATEKVINLFKGSGLSVCVVELPNTKDPDEFIKKNGAEAFKALLNSAVCDIEYKLLCAEKEIEINSDTSKLKYLTAAAEIIASSDDVLAREVYIDSLSRKYSTSKEALTKKVEEISNGKKEKIADAEQ